MVLLVMVPAFVGGATPAASAAPLGPVPAIGAWANDPSGGMYPEQRQCVENQAWWKPAADQAETPDSDHGHVHMGACIPERERLVGSSSALTIPVRLILHDNPGTFNYVSLVFKSPSTEVTVQKCYLVAAAANGACPSAPSTGRGDWQCDLDPARSGAQGTCEKWITFSAPLSAFNNSGLQEVRIRGFVPEPKRADGTSPEMRTNLNFQTYVSNGKATADVSREPYLRGKGWYTHSLYCESTVVSMPLPDAPLSGTWNVTLKQDTHSTDASLPVTHHFVSWDPDFHAVPPNPGRVVEDAAGVMPSRVFAFDTTTMTDGLHRLYQRADCRDDSLGSVNSGVLSIPVLVHNGG
jgi:hypothetical protein